MRDLQGARYGSSVELYPRHDLAAADGASLEAPSALAAGLRAARRDHGSVSRGSIAKKRNDHTGRRSYLVAAAERHVL